MAETTSATADPRPEWADNTRGQCPTCRHWPKTTKAGLVVKHKRSEPGRWHKVPCDGGGRPPLPEDPMTDDGARHG
jgi:hypothetical protein